MHLLRSSHDNPRRLIEKRKKTKTEKITEHVAKNSRTRYMLTYLVAKESYQIYVNVASCTSLRKQFALLLSYYMRPAVLPDDNIA
jgi:hypothetical protein